MEIATRCLRDGTTSPDPAPLLTLEDTLATTGGPAIFIQAVAELAACISQGRAQAQKLTIIALKRPPQEYQRVCQALSPSQLSILDCCTDPFGWLEQLPLAPFPQQTQQATSPSAPGPNVHLLSGILEQPDGLQRLQQQLTHAAQGAHSAPSSSPGSGPPHADTLQSSLETPPSPSQPPRNCVVVDSLSQLLDYFGEAPVWRWLHTAQRSAATSSMLCAVHADLHSSQALSALRHLASGSIQLEALSTLEQSLGGAPQPPQDRPLAGIAPGTAAGGVCRGGDAPHPSPPLVAPGTPPLGRVCVRLKRRAGRVRVQSQMYCLVSHGGEEGVVRKAVAYWDPPAVTLTPQALLETAGGVAGPDAAPAGVGAATSATAIKDAGWSGSGAAAGEEGLVRQMEGGMKLTLSREEEEARRKVQLPFEHQGEGAAYRTGDFRDYLPPEAGGTLEGGRRLGHILYVRDSASEYDSDEDPDDDLDL